jgi:hypothetical protein
MCIVVVWTCFSLFWNSGVLLGGYCTLVYSAGRHPQSYDLVTWHVPRIPRFKRSLASSTDLDIIHPKPLPGDKRDGIASSNPNHYSASEVFSSKTFLVELSNKEWGDLWNLSRRSRLEKQWSTISPQCLTIPLFHGSRKLRTSIERANSSTIQRSEMFQAIDLS